MQVTVDFFDGDDTFIAGEELFVQVLPGQRTAIAGEAFGAGRATRMMVNFPDDMSAFEPNRAEQRAVPDLGVETSRGDGLNVTRGRLTSRDRNERIAGPADRRLPKRARDHHRRRGWRRGSIAPGATISFEVVDGAPFAAIPRHGGVSGR